MSSPYPISTKKVTIRFGGLTAVNRVDFQLQKGEISALIGPNGAGKTTLFNLVTGVLRPNSGGVFFKGRDITRFTTLSENKIGDGTFFFQLMESFPGTDRRKKY